jgi:MFS superfamily sulfate permease-like transporter
LRYYALAAVWALAAMELVNLASITRRVHDALELMVALVILATTVILGAITVFALPIDKKPEK